MRSLRWAVLIVCAWALVLSCADNGDGFAGAEPVGGGAFRKPDVPAAPASILDDCAEMAAASVGVNVDDPNSIRAYVYLFVPLEEQAEFTWWEIDRIREEHAFTPIPEVAEMENLAKRIIMNLNVYMEVKQMALTGGDVSQDEIVSFEKALVSQMTKARGLIRNF